MIARNHHNIVRTNQALHFRQHIALNLLQNLIVDLAQISPFNMQVIIADVEDQAVELADFQCAELLAVPGKFEVKSSRALEHSNDVWWYPPVTIPPHTSRELLFLCRYRYPHGR